MPLFCCCTVLASMGISLAAYRARVGRFFRCHTVKGRHHLLLPSIRLSLPRIRVVFLAVTAFSLLILAGDVETNPGPNDKLEKLQSTLDKLVQNTESYQKENTEKLNAITSGISNLRERVTVLENKVVDQSRWQDDVSSMKHDVVSIGNNLSAVIGHVDALDNRLRRNNLIFKGIPEERGETWDRTEQIVTEFVKTFLKVDAGEIERAHRIGRKQDGFNRMIVVKFQNYKNKQEILSKAPSLKNVQSPKVWIDEDFSPYIQEARKKLRDFAKPHREAQKKVRFTFDKLFIDDRTYIYDPSLNQVVELQSAPFRAVHSGENKRE